MLNFIAQTTTRSRLTLALVALTTGGLLALALVAPSALGATGEACTNQAIREQQHATYLPDCRDYELVSPTQTNGNEVYGPLPSYANPFQASLEGAAIIYTADGTFSGALASGLEDQYLSFSSALGSPWQTLSLDPDNNLFGGLTLREIGGRDGATVLYSSPDLTCSVVESELPLTTLPAGESAEEYDSNLYVYNYAAASYTLITSVKPKRHGRFNVDGASANCSHVIFESEEYPSLAPEEAMYEWDEGTLRVASLLPDETQPVEGIAINNNAGRSDLNQISSNGARVFFTAEADEGVDEEDEEVFMRLDGAITVEVSAATNGDEDKGANFQMASKSGEQVFFTANYGLTATSSPGPKSCNKGTGAGCDLYDYDTATETLTDISAGTNVDDANGAHVIGSLGISEEGGVAYFAAAGQLVPGEGNTEAQDEDDDEANVYAYHDDQLFYVASIGETEAGSDHTAGSIPEEQVDAVNASTDGSEFAASRVSSDGEYLLFATDKQLRQSDGVTYDSTDAATGKQDFEDYEYSLTTGTVTCVSCDPDGASPQLHTDAELFATPFNQYEDNHSQMARNLANDGEVYFQTSNPVVPQAVNDSLNVYEFQPAGVGSCPAGQAAGCISILDSGTSADTTYFEGASANGEDVYLTTYAQLAPEDQQEERAMYDVRENGGFLATPPPTECEGEGTGPDACQGELSAPPTIFTPISVIAIGGGNLPPPPPQMQTTTTATATLTIVKHSVKGDTATILASVSGAGTIRASGSGVSTATKTPVEAKTVTLTLKLTKADAAKVAKHPGRTLRVEVTLLFTPVSATAVSKTVTVSFKAKKATKAKPKKTKPKKKKKKKKKKASASAVATRA